VLRTRGQKGERPIEYSRAANLCTHRSPCVHVPAYLHSCVRVWVFVSISLCACLLRAGPVSMYNIETKESERELPT
jgi:hypothetical protein